MTATSTGAKYAEQRYYPWGGTRWPDNPLTPTARRYTGQIEDAAIGLYFYNARYYDPALGRFLQADTIVPDPANPQSLNRYAYVLNNPLRYTDPTGHAYCPPEANGRCIDDVPTPRAAKQRPNALPVLTSGPPSNAGEFLLAPWADLFETCRINWYSFKLWARTADPLGRSRRYGWYYDEEIQYGIKSDIRALYSEYALLSSSAVRYYPGGADSTWWIEADTTTSPAGRYAVAWRTPKLSEANVLGIHASYRAQLVLTLDNRDALVPRLGASLETPFVLKGDGWSTRASPYYSYGVNLHGRRAAALAVESGVVAAVAKLWPAIVVGGSVSFGYAAR